MLKKVSIILWCISIMFCVYYTNHLTNKDKEKKLDAIRQEIALQCNREYIQLWYEDKPNFLEE